MNLKGWQKVFKFTFIQNIKNKTFIVGTIVMNSIVILMVLGINFIPPLLTDDSSAASPEQGIEETDAYNAGKMFEPVTAVYLLNGSGIDAALDLTVFTDNGLEVTEITAAELGAVTEKIRTGSSPEVLVEISDDELMYSILVSRPSGEATGTEPVEKGVCDAIGSTFGMLVESAKYESIGLSGEEVAEVTKGISLNSTIAGEPPRSEFAQIINSMVPMLSSMILFIFILAYGQLIAQSIASEKTSRVMELLLTSVRPLAVIIGKILAIGLVSLTQLTVMATVTVSAIAVTAPFGLLGQVFGSVSAAGSELQLVAEEIKLAFASFNPMVIVWIVVLFILGFVFYALIAGLIGASISRLEDLNVAMQPMVFISLLGFYLSYMPSAFNVGGDGPNSLTILSRYLPISSPFALPSALILGEMGGLETVISVLMLVVCDILMLLIVAKVYENVVLHTGDRIKLKDLVKLVRTKN